MSAQHELSRITAHTPPKLARSLMKTVVDTSMEETVRAIIHDKKTPRKEANELQRLLDRGDFRREDTQVDENVAAEIERYNDMMVDKSRENGRLPDPLEDKFFNERMKRIKNMKL